MRKYATISVPTEIKKALEKAKGEEEWGKFLLDLYKEAKMSKGKKAFEKLTNTLTQEDLKAITKSSEEFRKGFTLK